MKALVRLYPRAWRERYGEEFAEILSAQPPSLRLLADIIGGAVDARLQPQVRTTTKGDVMTTTLLKRCAAGGPVLTKREELIAAAAMIGSSLVFAGLYVGAKYLYRGTGASDAIDAFGIMAFPASLIVTMPFMYWKNHSKAAQAAMVFGLLAVLAGISYLTVLLD